MVEDFWLERQESLKMEWVAMLNILFHSNFGHGFNRESKRFRELLIKIKRL